MVETVDTSTLKTHDETQALERLYFPTWNPKEICEYKTDTLEKEEYATEFASERAEGKAEGLAEGEQKGLSAVLMRLLELKWGTVPPQYLEKIQKADSDALLRWAETILEANDIESVFKGDIDR